MRIVKNFIFNDQSKMIESVVIGRIDNLINYSNAIQSLEDEIEEGDFEVFDDEDSSSESPQSPISIPNELNTPAAIEWLRKIQFAGWLDEHFQPIKLTVAQMGCIVVKAQYELELNACWKDFAILWNMNKDTLRTGFLAGQDTKQTKAFNKKLNEV